MKNNNRMRKGKERFLNMVYRNVVGKRLLRLFWFFESLIWLGICVGILVVVVNVILFLGF